MSDIEDLQQNELVKDFASVKNDPELYELMSKTRPMLRLLVDVSDQIIHECYNAYSPKEGVE